MLTRPLGTGPLRDHKTLQTREASYRDWTHGHDELASRSTHGINRIVPDTGHYIQIDQPEAVNGAILDMLQSTRHAG